VSAAEPDYIVGEYVEVPGVAWLADTPLLVVGNTASTYVVRTRAHKRVCIDRAFPARYIDPPADPFGPPIPADGYSRPDVFVGTGRPR
jgi:hypothetical protein